MGEGGNERSHGRESYPGCNFSIMGDSAVEKDFVRMQTSMVSRCSFAVCPHHVT
jgi:hypothetical protein